MPKSNVVKLNKSTSKKSEKKAKSVETVSADLREASEKLSQSSSDECVLFGLYKLGERICQAEEAIGKIIAKYGIDARRDRDVWDLADRLEMMRMEERYIRENFAAFYGAARLDKFTSARTHEKNVRALEEKSTAYYQRLNALRKPTVAASILVSHALTDQQALAPAAARQTLRSACEQAGVELEKMIEMLHESEIDKPL